MASPLSKRQKVGTFYVVRANPRAALDPADPYAFEIGDDEEVVGVSQTIRRHGDIGDRRCIVVGKASGDHAEGDLVEPGILGEHLRKFVERVTTDIRQQIPFFKYSSVPLFKYSSVGIITNICAESLKCLEVKFQSHLESNGGLKANREFVEYMGPVMKVAARREDGGVGWYLRDSIGVLAEGICILRTLRDDCSGSEDVNEDVKDRLTTLVEDAEGFFWEVLEMGVADLDEDSAMSHSELEPNVLEYFKDKNNLSNIVGEWALMSAKRKERNEFSHPFGDHLNKEVRVTALDILKTMIEDPFCGAFKHVTSLSRYSLLLDHFKDKPSSGHGSLVSKLLPEMEKLLASKMEKPAVLNELSGFEF